MTFLLLIAVIQKSGRSFARCLPILFMLSTSSHAFDINDGKGGPLELISTVEWMMLMGVGCGVESAGDSAGSGWKTLSSDASAANEKLINIVNLVFEGTSAAPELITYQSNRGKQRALKMAQVPGTCGANIRAILERNFTNIQAYIREVDDGLQKDSKSQLAELRQHYAPVFKAITSMSEAESSPKR